MTPFLTVYLTTYLVATFLAVFAVRRELFGTTHRRALCEPWRLVTLALGIGLIAGAAPYSGDPTWDVPNSFLIGLATYATAPWAFRVMRDERRVSVRTMSALVLFFVPCWTYDVYILVRDGFYPDSWDSNLVLSGIVAACAGVFWNLEWAPGTPARWIVGKMVLVSLPVTVMVAAFVIQAW